MNTPTTNPTAALSRRAHFYRIIRGILGALLLAATTTAFIFIVFVNGCQNENGGIVNVCLTPSVIRTSPASGATNESLSKISGTSGLTKVAKGAKLARAAKVTKDAAVKIITATFSTPMDPKSITTTTFSVQQGSTYLIGTVTYSDTTAVFIVPNGLGSNLTYTCKISSQVKSVAGTALGTDYIWSFTTIAPGTPTLVAPANGAVNQATNPTLIWNVVPGANTYRLQVSTSNAFATTVYDDSTRTNTSQVLSGLTIATTYYWRVNSKISGGTSAYSTIFSFTTIAPPAAPVLVAPADVAINVATSPTLSWNASTGAATYRLQVSTSNTFATTLYDDSTNTGISQLISGLTGGTTYYWRVNAKNVAGTSAYATRSFTTITPGTPTLVAPVDSSVNISTSPTLVWNAVTGANTYRLQVSTSNTFATTIYDDSTRTNTSQALSGLSVGTTYYWRVNSKISGTTSAYSTVWYFTTIAPPAIPILLTPVNLSVNIATNPSLIWNAVTGANTYRLQVSTSNTFATTVYDDSTRTNTSQALSGLTIATTYYWRVNAKNTAGTSSYSAAWSFTTIVPPAAPVLVAPLDLAQNQATSLTLSWLTSVGANTYRLQVSTSNVFATTVFNDSTITGTSQPITGLIVGTTYYWRVNAKNTAGTSAYSTRSFTTIVAALQAPLLALPNDGDTVLTTSPTLSWNPSTGAATYRLQVDTSSSFTSPIFNDSTQTGLLYAMSGLVNGKTYYWHVNAKNSGGTSAYSTTWRFVVRPLPPPLLGSASTFGIMATSAITSTGNSIINGDVSLNPGTSMTGFPPAIVNGSIHINDGVSSQARTDLLTAYNVLKNLAPGTTISAGADLGALYPLGIPPGTYTSGSTMLVSTPLVLDAGGNANAVWVFQIGSSLTTGASISLANGAQAKNVYWVPTLDATVGVGTIFYGTIVSGRDVTAVTGSTINGRILAGATTAGTIALQGTVVNVPAP